ncbi:MAG: YHYH domain-containing protein [Bacteroidales bacterium]
MRKTFAIITLVLALSAMTTMAMAHSGGLDQNGGHWDHKTGTYHYHR